VLAGQVERGRLDFEQVLEKSFVESLRDAPERSAIWQPLIDRVFVYDGIVPINTHIVDGTVLVWLGESREEVAGLFLSESPEVLAWAESLYEDYRASADPLEAL